ncbi:MAG: hypothetical protein KF857_09230 [Fimbriimonadaceae bacterium]|nr:hypothetical protein [Fimbriimonadaceae bacterium]
MLAALLPLMSTLLVAGDAAAYFPTVPGTTWTYSEKTGRSQEVFTDKVGKPTKLLDKEVAPFTTVSHGRTSEPTFYLVEGDTVFVIFKSYIKKEVDDQVVREATTYQYPVLKVDDKRTTWEFAGKTEFMKTVADMVLKGTSRPIGKRKVLGKDVDCVEVTLDVIYGAAGEPPIKSVQRSVYGKGIGLVEMEQTTTVNKEKYSSKRTLVSMGDTNA